MIGTLRRAAIAALTGAVCLVAAGCGGGSGEDPADAGGGDGTGPAPEAGRAITGRIDAVYWSATDEKTVAPQDTTELFLEAIVATEDGAWKKLPGQVESDGSYRIDGLPETGGYWLRIFDGVERKDRYLWTDGEGPDLSKDFRGRAGLELASAPDTALEFHLTDADPWADGDALILASPNAGLTRTVAPTYASSANPESGATSVDGTQVRWAGRPLLSASQGDDVWLTQNRYVSDEQNNLFFLTPVRSVHLPAQDVADGEVTALQGALTEPAAFTYALEWKRSAFSAFKSDVHPKHAGDPDDHLFFVRAAPGGLSHGRLLAFELPVIDSAYIPADAGDVSMTLQTRNPYPSEWLLNGFSTQFPVTLPFLDGSADAQVAGEIGFVSAELVSKDAPAVPLVSPPKAVTVAGRATDADLTGVGRDPELAWSAPALGTPTSYEIELSTTHVENEPGPMPHTRVVVDSIATLVVPGDVTHVKLPPDLMQEGVQHLIRLRARRQAGQDVRRALWRGGLPDAWADAFTSFVTP